MANRLMELLTTKGEPHYQVRRMVCFLAVGGLVCLLELGTLAITKRFMPALAAVSIAYVVAVTTHFCLNKWWVFGSRMPVSRRELSRYALMLLVCWGCTMVLVHLVLHTLTANVLVARLAALPPTTVLGFVLMRSFVFAPPL